MRKFIIALFVVLCGSFLFAEPVTELKFEGLKKTKESFMQDLLKSYVGKDSDEINLKEVETVLQAQGLFSEIDVKVEKSDSAGESEGSEKTAALCVTVKEKITFIPLPFAMYSSSSGFMGGFMLMNMNAFGKHHMLVSGGFFSGTKQTGMVIYSKPAGDINHPGYSVFGSFSHKTDEVTDFDDNRYFEEEYLQARGNFHINENLNKYFSVSTGVSYGFMNLFTDNYSDDHMVTVSSSVNFNHVNWNGYYLITNAASVSGEVGYSSEENSLIEEIKFNGMLQYAFVPRFRTIWTVAGEAQSGKFLLNKADRGSIGSSIMYEDFKTDMLAGTGLTFEEAIVKMKFGTVSLCETYEFDVARDIHRDSVEWCQGVGASLKLYIKQIAFPAMNMGFSYNINQNDWKFVASFGMSM